jgi:hypothetical protein
MKFVISALMMSFVAVILAAQPKPSGDEFVQEIYDNASHELVTCSSYYRIARGAMKKAGHISGEAQMKEAGEQAILMAFKLATSGRSKDMARKVTLNRLKTEMELMKREIDYDFSNISLLFKYAGPCKMYIEDPMTLMEKWKIRIAKKYGK